EISRAVGQQLYLLYAQMLAPLVHDKGIVDGDAIDLVHAGGLELVIEPLERRALLVGAGGGEGAGQRENDDPLALEQVGGVHILPAEGIVPADALIAYAGLEGDFGDMTSDHGRLHLVRWVWTPNRAPCLICEIT